VLDEQGEETRTPHDENFVIVPPQLVLLPKQSQTVRVQWVGDPALQNEKAYRLLASQVPVDLAAEVDGAKVNVNYNYEVSLYVTPAGTRPDVKVLSLGAAEGTQGKQLVVTLQNNGSRRGILEKPVLELTAKDGKIIKLDGEKTALLEGQNIFPGRKRIVSLPWPEGLAEVPSSATLRTKYVGATD